MSLRSQVAAMAAPIGVVVLSLASADAAALDLLQAYQAALANDAQVASALNNLAAIRERVPQAEAALLPAANASAQVLRQAADSSIAPRRDFTSQVYGINLSYPLLRLQNVEQLEQSKLQVGVAEAQYVQARQDLIVRVTQAYFDVLGAQDTLAFIGAQKRAISEQLASAKRNFEVGNATITDQQEAQARFDLAVAQELAAENDLAVRTALLTQLIGRPAGELNTLRAGLTLEGPSPSIESEWANNARQNNLQVQQAQVGTEIARREIARQRYGHYPTVDLIGSLSHGRNQAFQFVGVNLNTVAIGLQVAVPLYAGGGIDARVREAARSLDKSQSDLENARRQAEQGTRAAFLGVNSGLGQVKALEAAERSSQLALDSNQLGYQVGVRINIDVLNAQQQLFSTRRDLAKARYDVLVNGTRLRQVAGTLAEADVAAINGLLEVPRPAPAPAPAPSGTSGTSGAPASPASGGSAAPNPAAPAATGGNKAGGTTPPPGFGTGRGRVTKPIDPSLTPPRRQ